MKGIIVKKITQKFMYTRNLDKNTDYYIGINKIIIITEREYLCCILFKIMHNKILINETDF